MFVLSGQFADVGRTLGLHCRCLRMFPGRVTLFTDVPSLFADVLTKPADLAIGDHRVPQSGQCKPRFTNTWIDDELGSHISDKVTNEAM